jgi:hypothetical protein
MDYLFTRPDHPRAGRPPPTGPNRAATSCAATTGAGAPSRSSVPSPRTPSPPTRNHRPSGTARARSRRGEPRSTSHAYAPPSSDQNVPARPCPRTGLRARPRDARRRIFVRRLGRQAATHRPSLQSCRYPRLPLEREYARPGCVLVRFVLQIHRLDSAGTDSAATDEIRGSVRSERERPTRERTNSMRLTTTTLVSVDGAAP